MTGSKVSKTRRLPIAPQAPVAKRGLALAPEARPIDRRVRPTYAVWELTLDCDLACRHCGSRAGRARPDELSTQECLDLVDQLASLGVVEVSLIGGEAYLRPDWLTIVEAVARKGMRPLMTTGGRGLSADMARRAASAGLAAVSISIDGLREAHDRLRGLRGSFDAAVRCLEHFGATEVSVGVNTQINRESAKDLGDVLELIGEKRVRAWQVQLTVAMGRAADEVDLLLQPYDLLEVFPRLADLKERSTELGVMLYPGNNIGYFGPYENVLRGSTPYGHCGGCGAGRATIGIEANGAIKGCPSLTTERWTAGNIRDAPLVEIWERGIPMRYTRDRTTDDLWGLCRDCYYADVCRGGCTWTAEVLFGRPGNNPYCHHRALELARVGRRERLAPRSPAPGVPFDHAIFELHLEPMPQSPSDSPERESI